MTTSSLYHTQGIRGYQYKKTERSGDTEFYYLHSTLKQLNCPCCESRETSIVQTGRTRDIRGLCIGLKKRLCAWRSDAFAVGDAVRLGRNRYLSVPIHMCVIPSGRRVMC